jgi:hypothetical protein
VANRADTADNHRMAMPLFSEGLRDQIERDLFDDLSQAVVAERGRDHAEDPEAVARVRQGEASRTQTVAASRA